MFIWLALCFTQIFVGILCFGSLRLNEQIWTQNFNFLRHWPVELEINCPTRYILFRSIVYRMEFEWLVGPDHGTATKNTVRSLRFCLKLGLVQSFPGRSLSDLQKWFIASTECPHLCCHYYQLSKILGQSGVRDNVVCDHFESKCCVSKGWH